MGDIEKIRDFAGNIHVDGRHEGDEVTATGSFIAQQFPGVAAVAGSKYQFVIQDDLALVAILPRGFLPMEGARYNVTGSLRGVGEFGMFPGIEIAQISDGC